MEWFDSLLDAVQAVLMSILVKLGPFMVALMPALFTAYSIYHTFQAEAGHELALFFAVVVGLAMETVGIVATHTAIDLYNAVQEGYTQRSKFRLMVWLVPVYVIGVSLVVGFSGDAFTPLVKGLGVASPWLTCIVYVAVALARDIKRTQARQRAEELARQQEVNEDRDWDRRKERLELEFRHEEKLARIEAKRPTNRSNFGRLDRPGDQQDRPDLDGLTVQDGVLDGQLDDLNERRRAAKERLLDDVLRYLDGHQDASLADIGRHIGRSKSTAGNYVDELQQAGRLYRNGHGWEVR